MLGPHHGTQLQTLHPQVVPAEGTAAANAPHPLRLNGAAPIAPDRFHEPENAKPTSGRRCVSCVDCVAMGNADDTSPESGHRLKLHELICFSSRRECPRAWSGHTFRHRWMPAFESVCVAADSRKGPSRFGHLARCINFTCTEPAIVPCAN